MVYWTESKALKNNTNLDSQNHYKWSMTNKNFMRGLWVVFVGVIILYATGCAPLPPIESSAPAEKPKPETPMVSDAERDSIINVRLSFGYERWRNGEWKTALEHYNVVKLYDLNHEKNIYRAMSDCYVKLQQLDSAMYAYQEGIKYFPDDDYLRSAMSIMLRNQGKFDEAIEQQRQAVRIKPEDIGYLETLKDLYIRASRYDEAIEVLQRLVELDPDNEAVASELTSMIRTHRDPSEYLKALSDAIINFPDDHSKKIQYANALAEQGMDDKAAVEFEKYTKVVPDDYLGWLGLAKARDNLSQYESAINAYRKVVDLNPDAVQEMVAIGENYIQLKNWTAARTWALRALNKKSDFGPALLMFADIYYRCADAIAGDSPKYPDKLVFTIALGLYERAAKSNDAQARSQASRMIQSLRGNDLVPTRDDWFMRKSEILPTGKSYEWITSDWQEVKYIEEFLKNYQ